MVIGYYKEFIKNHDMKKVIIGGVSSGAGYVLTLLQQVKALGLPLPAKLILISPYVDITEDIERDEDPMLDKNTLLISGKAWTNVLDLKDSESITIICIVK